MNCLGFSGRTFLGAVNLARRTCLGSVATVIELVQKKQAPFPSCVRSPMLQGIGGLLDAAARSKPGATLLKGFMICSRSSDH